MGGSGVLTGMGAGGDAGRAPELCKPCSEEWRGHQPRLGLGTLARGGGWVAVCQVGQGEYRAGPSEDICPSTLLSLRVRALAPSQLPLALAVLWGV